MKRANTASDQRCRHRAPSGCVPTAFFTATDIAKEIRRLILEETQLTEAGVKEVRLLGISVSNLDLAREEKSKLSGQLELGF